MDCHACHGAWVAARSQAAAEANRLGHMPELQAPDRFLSVGAGQDQRRIAVNHRNGDGTGLFWLGGFNSTMDGAKATALDTMGAKWGAPVTRFDYSGCGQSGGNFAEGTISRWLEEATAVFEQVAKGPQVLVGSSMGAWLALLLNRRLRTQATPRITALVLIAPAVDMTEDLIWADMSQMDRHTLLAHGRIQRPSDYGAPLIITQKLIEDGRQHCLLKAPIQTHCPIHIIHGAKDQDVPKSHAFKLMSYLLHDEVSFSLVPDGDHRLSRDEDLVRIERIVKVAREW